MDLKKHIRSIPDYPKKGILFRDITTLIKNPEAFKFTNDKIIELCSSIKRNETVVPANFNSPQQVVISGSEKGVKSLIKKAKELGAKMTILLNVGGAFHSPLMKTARVFLEEALDSTEFSDTICPVYTNADAKPHSSSSKIKSLLYLSPRLVAFMT